jgi:hypothetical protein
MGRGVGTSNTIPTLRRSSFTLMSSSYIFFPSISISPSFICASRFSSKRRFSERKSVVIPLFAGPSTDNISFARISKSRLWITRLSLK